LVCSMASQERFELPTVRLEGVCSIRLSYWDVVMYQRQDLLYYPNIKMSTGITLIFSKKA
jgi:hypothetical protein